MALPGIVPPPAQQCRSARPTVRSVALSGVWKRRAWKRRSLRKSTRRLRLAPCSFHSATESRDVILDAKKMASHSLARATGAGALGKTSAAHAGVAQATMVQLMAWRVMSSIAGLAALDEATLARETLAGSCCASRAGFAPVMPRRAAPER